MAFYDANTQAKLQKKQKKLQLTPAVMKSASFKKGFVNAALKSSLTEKEAAELYKEAIQPPQGLPKNFSSMGVPSAPAAPAAPQAPQGGAGSPDIIQLLTELIGSPKGTNALEGAGMGAIGGGLGGAALGGGIGALTGRNNKEGDKSGRNALIGALLGGGAGALGGGAIGGMQGWDKELGLLDSLKQKATGF